MSSPTRASRRRERDPADLLRRVESGDARAVARLISMIEDADPAAPSLLAALAKLRRQTHVVGMTGPPGVGKSTLTNALVAELRRAGKRVGVLAVDPSSSYTGGALLGDRVRMQEHALDPEVYIRSMASRGQLGGLAWTTPQAVRVMEAAGCEIVIVETVGVGQNEVDVAALSTTTLVILAPGMGDDVQAAKAGVLEAGDIYVVNKADHDGAKQLRRELHSTLGRASGKSEWSPPINMVVAQAGNGVPELLEQVHAHQEWCDDSHGVDVKRERTRAEINSLILTRLHSAWQDPTVIVDTTSQLVDGVVNGELTSNEAASQLMRALANTDLPAGTNLSDTS